MEEKIAQDLKEAQLNRNVVVVSTLRILLSELKYAQIQKNRELEEDDVISVIQKELKKRKEAAEGFRQGNREEQALKEEAEAKVLEKYLPTQISDEELTKIVDDSILSVGASSMSDMGKVIGMVRDKVGSSADGARVSGLVKSRLLK